MTEIGIALVIMLWLGLGGWAYGTAVHRAAEHNVAAFIWALILGPAAAGFVIATKRPKP